MQLESVLYLRVLQHQYKIGERNILSLKTRCDNTTNGCDWVGELHSLDKHLASCGLTCLPCPNKCHQGGDRLNVVNVFRKDLLKHTRQECPLRQYQCPHCKEVGKYRERTTTHLKECPMLVLPCPNPGCKICKVRCNLSKHRKECIFEAVACKHATIGCKEKVLRKDLEKHEGDSQQHLQLAIDTIHKQQSIIREQESKLAYLWSKETIMKYKFTQYNQHKTASDTVHSPAFYTSPGGYRMCISVDANGVGEAKGTHVSVFAFLMKGENDDHLPWPFTGIFTVELFNQLEDKNHYSKSTKFPDDGCVSCRVVNGERSSSSYGHLRYITHSALGYNAARNCQYLMNDCLYFKISVDAKTSSKPWLC